MDDGIISIYSHLGSQIMRRQTQLTTSNGLQDNGKKHKEKQVEKEMNKMI